MPDFYANDGASYMIVVSDGHDECDVEGDPPDHGPVIAALATTTAPEATTAACPTVTPGMTTALTPMKQWSSSTTGFSTAGMMPVSRR